MHNVFNSNSKRVSTKAEPVQRSDEGDTKLGSKVGPVSTQSEYRAQELDRLENQLGYFLSTLYMVGVGMRNNTKMSILREVCLQ